MLKILHTGDIHLDSAFSSLDPKSAEIRRNELRAAFTSMMTYAKMKADILLIAGDLFDDTHVTRETVNLLVRECKSFGGPIVISPGNHDSATPKSIWQKNIFPENVHVFTSNTLSHFDFPSLNTTVYGYAFTSPNLTEAPFAGKSVEDRSRTNILLAHCDTASTPSATVNCPTTAAEIRSFGADYAALGHIHNPPMPDSDCRLCYSGCLEGRAFDELGPKGACFVEIDKNGTESRVAIKRIRFSKKRYEKATLSLPAGTSTNTEIGEAIDSLIAEKKYGEDTLLELKLKGYVAPTLLINTDVLEEACRSLFYLKLTDETVPDIDTDSLEDDVTVRGEVYRNLAPALSSSDPREKEVAVRALRYAFSALSGEV